jgi:hypothetical protein
MDDALNWLRANSVNPDDIDDATLAALTNLAGVPMPGARLSVMTKRLWSRALLIGFETTIRVWMSWMKPPWRP